MTLLEKFNNYCANEKNCKSCKYYEAGTTNCVPNFVYQQGRTDAINELTNAFDYWIKSSEKTAYYWTEFQVAFMKIAEEIKEKTNDTF